MIAVFIKKITLTIAFENDCYVKLYILSTSPESFRDELKVNPALSLRVHFPGSLSRYSLGMYQKVVRVVLDTLLCRTRTDIVVINYSLVWDVLR